MRTREQLEDRIRYKNRAVWIFGLSWAILSGVLFYLLYPVINLLGLCSILLVVAFVLDLSVGFAIRARTLLLRNVLVYPCGIVLAQVLNEISPKWVYTDQSTLLSFGVTFWIILLCFYIAASGIAHLILRFTIGYEMGLENPVSSQFFYLEPAEEENPIELLRGFVELFKNVSPKVSKEDRTTWLKFEMEPHRYAIAFTSKNKGGVEVNILSSQIRSDVLCEADEEESGIIISMIASLFATWKEQGHIGEWRPENKPEYSEELRDALFKAYTTAARIPVKIPSMQQVKYNTIEPLRRNKKQVLYIVVTAIISPLVVYFITKSLAKISDLWEFMDFIEFSVDVKVKGKRISKKGTKILFEFRACTEFCIKMPTHLEH